MYPFTWQPITLPLCSSIPSSRRPPPLVSPWPEAVAGGAGARYLRQRSAAHVIFTSAVGPGPAIIRLVNRFTRPKSGGRYFQHPTIRFPRHTKNAFSDINVARFPATWLTIYLTIYRLILSLLPWCDDPPSSLYTQNLSDYLSNYSLLPRCDNVPSFLCLQKSIRLSIYLFSPSSV